MRTALNDTVSRLVEITLIAVIMLGAEQWASAGTSSPSSHGPDPVPMIIIPAGEFLMGSPEGQGRPDEWPQRSVYLDAFEIDQVEVTNERYMRFVKATGHRPPPDPFGTGPLQSIKGLEQLPVVQTTWYDAKAYCTWAQKRLPTEAEWEKAARGTDGRLYPWGNDPPTPRRANFDREWDGQRTLHAVGSLPEGDSPYGVKDMAGNAREWVADWYEADYYAHAPSRNPQGPEKKGVVRSIRGGSWHSPANDVRAAARGRGGFALQTHGTGFRCARSLNAATE
ncbi:MAG: formylglycine-generating enzyme family protein [Nitrospira sp.]|nr:formylglycine-generating enzyme family protein [Nitrospira sp.]MCP9462557.1 formylglycine-generating enzyme family protein [Nitrospira sp.]MCP9475325.1 formylglycine-generating enzyme family protein [Nitrospira sp.]